MRLFSSHRPTKSSPPYLGPKRGIVRKKKAMSLRVLRPQVRNIWILFPRSCLSTQTSTKTIRFVSERRRRAQLHRRDQVKASMTTATLTSSKTWAMFYNACKPRKTIIVLNITTVLSQEVQPKRQASLGQS